MASSRKTQSEMPHDAARAVDRMPFLVGLWMSRADDENGTRDDAREKQAILQLLGRYGRDIHIPSICRDAARQSLQYAQDLDDWAQIGALSMNQVGAVLKDVDAYVKPERALAYRKMLYHIALGVARSHGEFGVKEEKAGIGTFVLNLLRRRDDDDYSPENVSAKERAALDMLRAAMRIGK